MKRKRVLTLVLTIFLAVTLSVGLTACNNNEPGVDTRPVVVYLGDSIAEAILGPSPVNLRELYGYYSVLGRRNEYNYFNRSVSGHKSSQLYDVVATPDEDAKITHTRISTADIIHVSILGNDVLQTNLGPIVVETVDAVTAAIAAGKPIDDSLEIPTLEAIINTEYDGNNGGGSYQNIADVVLAIREANPDATLIFQNVYNPVSEDTTLINDKDATADYKGSVTELAERGVTPDQYRYYGGLMLRRLNRVLEDYLDDNNGDEFIIADAYSAFDAIYEADPERGKALIFSDFVHPSNEGHAVLADMNQKLLESLELANAATALKNYKEFRIDIINNYFKDDTMFPFAIEKINSATSCEQVTKIFFEAIKGKQVFYV